MRDHERALKERIADLDESQRRAIQLLVQVSVIVVVVELSSFVRPRLEALCRLGLEL